mgnify:CR=1 FL=1
MGTRSLGATGTRSHWNKESGRRGGAWGTFEPEGSRGTHPTNPKFRFFDYTNGLC